MGVSITVYDSADIKSLQNEIDRANDAGEFPSGQILKLFFSYAEIDVFIELLNKAFKTSKFDSMLEMFDTGELTDGKEVFQVFNSLDEAEYPGDLKYVKFRDDYARITLLEVENPVIIIQ